VTVLLVGSAGYLAAQTPLPSTTSYAFPAVARETTRLHVLRLEAGASVAVGPRWARRSRIDPEIEERVSRRRAIKRLGAVTAAAWSAPVLSTLKTPALALTCYFCQPLGQPGDVHCSQQPDCGAEPTGNPCSCLRTMDDVCACHSCVFCDNPAVTPCEPEGCPPGWICALSCCSDPAAVDDFVCLPLCGAGLNPDPCVGRRAAGTGRTSMG
jgi:hypothetical protein